MIKFHCPTCTKKLSIREIHSGRGIACPGCGATLIVPAADEIPQIAPTPLKTHAASAVMQTAAASTAEPTPPIARPRENAAHRQLQRIALLVTVTGGLGLAFIAGLTLARQTPEASNVAAVAAPAVQVAPAPAVEAPAPAPEQVETESIRAALMNELQQNLSEQPVPQTPAETPAVNAEQTPPPTPARPRLVDAESDEAPVKPQAKAPVPMNGGNAHLLELLRKRDDAKAAAEVPPPAQNPPEAAAPKNNPPAAMPPAARVKPPLVTNHADACGTCLSSGNVPLQYLPRYVRVERELAFMQHNPNAGLPWQACRKCAAAALQTDVPPKESSQQAFDLHQKWERLAGKELIYAETRHVSIHSLAPEPFTRATAEALDKLATQLQQLTGSTLLVQTRPHSHALALGWEEHDYTLLSNVLRADGISFEYLQDSMNSVNSTRNCSLAYALRAYGGGLPWIPVVTFGQMLMREASDDKAPDWLVEGFGSYCESISFNRQNYCVARDYYQVRSGTWNQNLKQQCKGVPISWESIFCLRRDSAMTIQALGAWSVVDFLMKSDPKKFCQFVIETRGGKSSKEALEKVYGRSIEQMQTLWWQWLKTQK